MRHHQEGHRQQQPNGNAVLRDGEDLLVGPVAGLELAVFAVEHGVLLLFLLG
jgi:hypothetical protein